jgi:hypothetical protein
MQHELFLEKTPYLDFEIFSEDVFSKFAQGASQGYESGKKFAEGDFAKFADRAKQAIAKSSQFADHMSKTTGVSPPLALAMTMAGVTGGASALPMAAIMYFARKHINKMLVNPVSNLVDLAFDSASNKNQKKLMPTISDFQEPDDDYMPYQPKKKRKMMPIDASSWEKVNYSPKKIERLRKREQKRKDWQQFMSKYNRFESHENLSFKNWLLFEEEQEGWLDYGARMLGKGVGAVGGAVVGYGKSIMNALGNRIKEIYQYVSGNPREAVKLASIVGLSMLTGAVVGKISHDVVNAVSNKISGVTGVNPDEVHNSVSQASGIEKGSGDFSGGSSSSGDFGGSDQGASSAVQAKSDAVQATVDAKSDAAQNTMNAKKDIFGRFISPEKQETQNLFRAIRKTFGGNSPQIHTSGIPHGMTIDMNGDGIPDNRMSDYYNKLDKTYYGANGQPEWKFDGKNIIKLK